MGTHVTSRADLTSEALEMDRLGRFRGLLENDRLDI
jgi:hypothetical protein